VLDESTTLNLSNSTLSIEGIVEATPHSIRIEQADEVDESNVLSLTGIAGALSSWSSAYYEIDTSEILGGGGAGVVNGFSDKIAVFAPPAGATFAALPASGEIAYVVPEPTTITLLAVALVCIAPQRRRR
jgi:hypothetical protein